MKANDVIGGVKVLSVCNVTKVTKVNHEFHEKVLGVSVRVVCLDSIERRVIIDYDREGYKMQRCENGRYVGATYSVSHLNSKFFGTIFEGYVHRLKEFRMQEIELGLRDEDPVTVESMSFIIGFDKEQLSEPLTRFVQDQVKKEKTYGECREEFYILREPSGQLTIALLELNRMIDWGKVKEFFSKKAT